MKRFLLLISALILFSFVVGCGNKTTSTTPTANTNSLTSGNTVQTQNPASTPQSKEVTLDKDSWKKLNIFFTNFVEADVPFFEKDKLSNDELILFGIHHIAINDKNIIDYNTRDNSFGRISAKNIDSSVEKYYGKKTINHHTVLAYKYSDGSDAYCTYKDGYYSLPAPETEIWPICHPTGGYCSEFAQAEKLIDNGNNIYICYINIYSAYDNFADDRYTTTPEQWKKDNKPDLVPTLGTKMKATIKKESDGRYILIDYLEDK